MFFLLRWCRRDENVPEQTIFDEIFVESLPSYGFRFLFLTKKTVFERQIVRRTNFSDQLDTKRSSGSSPGGPSGVLRGLWAASGPCRGHIRLRDTFWSGFFARPYVLLTMPFLYPIAGGVIGG